MDTGPTLSYDEKNDSNYVFSFKSMDALVAGEATKRHLIEREKKPLSKEDSAVVMHALRDSSDGKIVSRHSGEDVDGRSLKRLHRDEWLNEALYSWTKSHRFNRSKYIVQPFVTLKSFQTSPVHVFA